MCEPITTTLPVPIYTHRHSKPFSTLGTWSSMAELESPNVMMPKLITFLSSMLQRVAESNDLSRQFQPQKISVFHGLSRPTISIQSYLERIFKYANCSPSCFIVAYVYLDRFAQRQPSLPINSFNVHRLLITSVLVAVKFMDDIYYNNAYYAKVGGISTMEMNYLEVDFLFGLGFNLNVTPNTFHTYCAYLQREMMLQPPLNSAESSLNLGRSSVKAHLCFNEDEASHQKQQLAV
ncbi:Cyclin-U4-1 [Turnera subulata]|uniref:Cyclin n=1 Tax=Turnera subulata TaxID=218843 RepID=A0A9Q0GCR6_9ROSI|nr:Cyclin-U4-1 [Turnera subulata]